jgi:hypothetical protein
MGFSAVILPGHVFSGGWSFYTGRSLTTPGGTDIISKLNTGRYADCRDTAGGGYILRPGAEFLFPPSDRLSFSTTHEESLPRNLTGFPPRADPFKWYMPEWVSGCGVSSFSWALFLLSLLNRCLFSRFRQ